MNSVSNQVINIEKSLLVEKNNGRVQLTLCLEPYVSGEGNTLDQAIHDLVDGDSSIGLFKNDYDYIIEGSTGFGIGGTVIEAFCYWIADELEMDVSRVVSYVVGSLAQIHTTENGEVEVAFENSIYTASSKEDALLEVIH